MFFLDNDSDSSNEIEEANFPVAMWDVEQCDPKKCSGRKLLRHNLIKRLKLGQKFSGIVLTPMGKLVILIYYICIIANYRL